MFAGRVGTSLYECVVRTRLGLAVIGAIVALDGTPSAATAGDASDAARVAALEVRYQAAVERNDADAMAESRHPGFVLRLGDGRRYTRDDLLRSARERHAECERQIEDPGTQSVVYGDAAVVTARLWLKGTQHGERFERGLCFSDTYVRTATGWKYAFGQASLPLPP